jgi:exopolysaccharide production protein ExoZ
VRHKLTGIQCLRAVAALLVVLYHVQLFEQKMPGPTVLPAQLTYGMAGVDLFFVISGFIVTAISLCKFGVPGYALHFLRLRFTRIYPTYWVYFFGLLAVYLVSPNMVNHTHGQPNLLLSFLLLPQSGTPLLFVSWTLVFELFFYAVFAVLLRWLRQSHLPYVLCAWAVIVVAGNLTLDTDQPVLGLIFSPLILEFIMGCGVALFLTELGRRASWLCMVLGVGGFIVGSAFLDVTSIEFGWWSRSIIYGPSAALLVAGIIGVERSGVRFPRLFVLLGDASYSLYLSHILVLGAVTAVWVQFVASPAPANHIAGLSIELLATTVWALISFRCIERPLLTLLRGRRAPPVAHSASVDAQGVVAIPAEPAFLSLRGAQRQTVIARSAATRQSRAGQPPSDTAPPYTPRPLAGEVGVKRRVRASIPTACQP